MYCHACGSQLADTATFCYNCGVAVTPKTTAPNLTESAQTPAQSRRLPAGRPAVVAGVIGLIAICCLGAALIAWWDPGNFIGRYTGSYDAALTAMPPETGIYLGVNLLAVDQDRLAEIQVAFEESARDTAGERVFDDLQDELDDLWDDLDREYGINFENDIMPWLGQYAGVGLVRFDLDRFGEPVDVQWVAAVESRNRQAADAFVDKFIIAYEDVNRVRFSQSDYNQVAIYEVDTRHEWERIAIARSGNLLLIGDSARTIEQAVDAQDGQSLADNNRYHQMRRKLPRQRLATFFLGAQFLDDMSRNLQPLGFGDPLGDLPIAGIHGLMAAVTTPEAGIQIDMVTAYDIDQMSPAMAEITLYKPDRTDIDAVLPDNTLAYVAGYPLNLVWSNLRQSLDDAIGRRDVDEALELFRDEFGFNPDRDLFPLLDGRWALAIVPSSSGFLAELDIPIGVIALFQTSDEQQLQSLARNVSRELEYHGLYTEDRRVNDLTLYSVESYWNEPLLTYGVGSGYLLLGSSDRELGALFAGGSSLADQASYKQTWQEFPRGMVPSAYIQMDELLDNIGRNLSGWERESFEAATLFLRPINRIAAALEMGDREMQHARLILFIEAR